MEREKDAWRTALYRSVERDTWNCLGYTGSWGQSNERLSPGSLVCTESSRPLEGIFI